MQDTIRALEDIITEYTPLIQRVSAATFSAKPVPGKWSKKEILGHLIDSAQNNIRRFIVAQYEDLPQISYRQDDWVVICNYQHYAIDDLVDLWRLLNCHIVMILKNTPPEMQRRSCITGEPHTIEWLAADYNRHLLHHLHQLLDLEPIPY